MGQQGTPPMPEHGTLSEKRTRTVKSILSAAMLIVTEEGISALSMSTLAARAGVSRQTLYNYYPDVDGVLTGMVEMGDEGAAELASRMGAEQDARLALGVFVRAAVASVVSGHPSPLAIVAALPAELREAMSAHEARAERSLVELLRRGREEGVFRGDLDAELDGRILHRAAFAGADLANRPGIDPELLSERLLADLLRMVAADRSAGSTG